MFQIWEASIRRGLYMEGLIFGILRHLFMKLLTVTFNFNAREGWKGEKYPSRRKMISKRK